MQVCKDAEDIGWMLVHKSPRAPMLLSVCVGSGLQILCTVFFVLLFAAIGILSPPNRGDFVIAILVSYSLYCYPFNIYALAKKLVSLLVASFVKAGQKRHLIIF